MDQRIIVRHINGNCFYLVPNLSAKGGHANWEHMSKLMPDTFCVSDIWRRAYAGCQTIGKHRQTSSLYTRCGSEMKKQNSIILYNTLHIKQLSRTTHFFSMNNTFFKNNLEIQKKVFIFIN